MNGQLSYLFTCIVLFVGGLGIGTILQNSHSDLHESERPVDQIAMVEIDSNKEVADLIFRMDAQKYLVKVDPEMLDYEWDCLIFVKDEGCLCKP